MTRVAAIDCGTNSIRLLVTDLADGAQRDVDRRMEIVRLGQGVDRTGRLADEALARTFAALGDYAGAIEAAGAEQVRMVATSATRDAANSDEFAAGVRRILGVEPDVISGDEEAALSFTGATRDLPPAIAAAPHLVVDIGGGSTELVLGATSPRTSVAAGRSVDIGSVRLTERRLASDPPAPAEIAAARADVEAALDEAARTVDLAGAGSVVGVAGSVTTVAAIHLGLSEYDPAAIHHCRVPVSRIREIRDTLLASTRAERAANPAIHPGRVDVIAAGALILASVLDRSGVAELVASECDILDGIAWSLA